MSKKEAIIVFLLTVVLVLFFLPFASRLPDTLEKIAQEKKFLGKEKTFFNAPIPGYAATGIKNEKLSSAVAGICGVGAAFLLSYSLALLLKKNKKL